MQSDPVGRLGKITQVMWGSGSSFSLPVSIGAPLCVALLCALGIQPGRERSALQAQMPKSRVQQRSRGRSGGKHHRQRDQPMQMPCRGKCLEHLGDRRLEWREYGT